MSRPRRDKGQVEFRVADPAGDDPDPAGDDPDPAGDDPDPDPTFKKNPNR